MTNNFLANCQQEYFRSKIIMVENIEGNRLLTKIKGKNGK